LVVSRLPKLRYLLVSLKTVCIILGLYSLNVKWNICVVLLY
jgi:hypothetical protein